jgi:hypothetical protein
MKFEMMEKLGMISEEEEKQKLAPVTNVGERIVVSSRWPKSATVLSCLVSKKNNKKKRSLSLQKKSPR